MSQTEPIFNPQAASGNPDINVATHPLGSAALARLSLTDFLDVASLQEVQDSFMALTRLRASIRDAEGTHVTAPTDTTHRAQSDAWLDYLISPDTDCDDVITVPIIVEGQELGSISIEPCGNGPGPTAEGRQRFRAAARRMGIDAERVEALLDSAEAALAPSRASSIQFLYLLANHIARLCYQEYHARQRVEELSALYKVSMLLSAHRDLQQVLDTAARSVAEVMNVKAVSIRLIGEQDENMLLSRAVYNLSDEYLNKGPIHIDRSELFRQALRGKPVYVENVTTDPRMLYPADALREGLVSMLCAGMTYQGKPIGCIQLFTGEQRTFSRFQVNLVQAMTHLLATAIESAKLDQARMENHRMIRQLHLAADVQRRMLPGRMPNLPPLDIAARYVPSFELGGDFYDFIDLDGHLGVVVGDVVGKGVAASLLMASVRASLRAYAQDLYDLDQIIARVNTALTRDTRDNEFATLWYGVIDPGTLRLTYCNAGHDPPLLLRDGQIHYLRTGGMIVGVDQHQQYTKDIWQLRVGDVILLYTDGLVDAFNFDEQRFGRTRIEKALREANGSASDILNHVLWTMRRFTGIRRGLDDTTLVVIKINPPTV